jgi:hypothetical protein
MKNLTSHYICVSYNITTITFTTPKKNCMQYEYFLSNRCDFSILSIAIWYDSKFRRSARIHTCHALDKAKVSYMHSLRKSCGALVLMNG